MDSNVKIWHFFTKLEKKIFNNQEKVQKKGLKVNRENPENKKKIAIQAQKVNKKILNNIHVFDCIFSFDIIINRFFYF